MPADNYRMPGLPELQFYYLWRIKCQAKQNQALETHCSNFIFSFSIELDVGKKGEFRAELNAHLQDFTMFSAALMHSYCL